MSRTKIRASGIFDRALQEDANGELRGVQEAGVGQRGLRLV